MRGFGIETKFEKKEITNEPNKVGEYAPAMGSQSTGWDSLKYVPFKGNQNAFTKASISQNKATNVQSKSNAFTKAISATSITYGSSYDKLQSRFI